MGDTRETVGVTGGAISLSVAVAIRTTTEAHPQVQVVTTLAREAAGGGKVGTSEAFTVAGKALAIGQHVSSGFERTSRGA